MGLGKSLLYGGLGFVIGGPIGAIIGAVIGLFSGSTAASSTWSIDNGETSHSQRHGYSQRQGYSQQRRGQRPTQGDLQVSLLVLIAAVLKADGHVRKSELEKVKQFLVQNYGEDDSLHALQLLKGILQQNFDYKEVARQIKSYTNYSVRLTFLHFLLDLAYADGEYAEAERSVIENISAIFDIAQADYKSLLSLYQKQKDPNWAYAALEIEPTATDEEVKKAYRRMAMKYHPDKVASAGEEIQKKATEKFRAINEAYETIKTARGM